MTLLIASIGANTLDEAATRAQKAWAAGAEAVELRLDSYIEDPAVLAKYLHEHGDRTWVLTRRGMAEGGHAAGDAVERADFLALASSGSGAIVDFELADWRQSAAARERLIAALPTPDGSKSRLILSSHNCDGPFDNPAAVVEDALRIRASAVAKVAYRANDIGDTFAALDLMHEHKDSVIALAMGEPGLWTRILPGKLGAFASYGSLDADAATAPGQLTIDEMRGGYRWGEIDEETRVFGVLGDPVMHSMSPLLFNRWFAEANVNAVYLPLRVASTPGCLEGFLSACVDRPWLDVGGFSVTLPHKSTALRWIGDGADRVSKSIGALNTLTFRDGGVTGCNTDCDAALNSMISALGCSKSELAGLPVDLLGTGGAARAVLAGLREVGCAVTVYGRSPSKTRELASSFAATAASWDDRLHRTGEVLINATSVGMWPKVDASPMPPEGLSGCRLVFDLIYNPSQTRLLRDAAGAGVATLNGLDMFIRQAAAQFSIWTDTTADTSLAHDLIVRELNPRTPERLPKRCAEPRASARADSQCEKPSRAGSTRRIHDDQSAAGKTHPTLPDSRALDATETDAAASSKRGQFKAIALIGLRGAGKTAVGRELAALLVARGDSRAKHVDVDQRITESAGMTIAEIFAREGEEGFRRREVLTIADLVVSVPAVVSLGGGAVLNPENVERIKSVATVVWLTAPTDVLWTRIAADPATAASRPSLTDRSGPAELQQLLTERTPHYKRAADLTIDTSTKNPAQIAAEILDHLGEERDPPPVCDG